MSMKSPNTKFDISGCFWLNLGSRGTVATFLIIYIIFAKYLLICVSYTKWNQKNDILKQNRHCLWVGTNILAPKILRQY